MDNFTAILQQDPSVMEHLRRMHQQVEDCRDSPLVQQYNLDGRDGLPETQKLAIATDVNQQFVQDHSARVQSVEQAESAASQQSVNLKVPLPQDLLSSLAVVKSMEIEQQERIAERQQREWQNKLEAERARPPADDVGKGSV